MPEGITSSLNLFPAESWAFNYTSQVCLVKKWSKMCFLSLSESPVTGSIPFVPGAPVNSRHKLLVEEGCGWRMRYEVESWRETFFKAPYLGLLGQALSFWRTDSRERRGAGILFWIPDLLHLLEKYPGSATAEPQG